MNETLQTFQRLGLIPVIKIDDAAQAAPLAQALCAGGLPVAEVTFRTAAAAAAIRSMKETCPQMLVGAGTVLSIAQVDEALAAGAEFIVSPGLNPKVVAYCQTLGIPVTPGVSSPTEIEAALELGLEVVKFFPAEASGGLAKIKAMSAPYPNLKFMPTGGINTKNLNAYLEFPRVIACGGSFMVSDALLAAGRFDEITRLTREAVDLMLGFETVHVGINMESGQAAEETADRLSGLFGFAKGTRSASFFAGTGIELMNTPYLGTHGHLAIRTNDMTRAMYQLGLRGCSFQEETAKYDEKGRLTLIYLAGEFGGFAVHLLQK